MSNQRPQNITWHEGKLAREERWRMLGCRGATLWFTGLSASGKSAISSALEQTLVGRGVYAYRLDGDNVRFGLNRDLGFSRNERDENIRRMGEVAKLFADSGALAIVSVISPYRDHRDRVRKSHDADNLPFLEIFVDTPLDICEARDPKGLYKKARAGEIPEFTGVSDAYEPPEAPELVLKGGERSIEWCVSACLDLLAARGLGIGAQVG